MVGRANVADGVVCVLTIFPLFDVEVFAPLADR